ncbi:CpaF family protein [Actinomadura kijaniata]|uniref:Pilus assembly protein CpaF n=1 Tax=Actinomadura namibiensis TaxID=182080 RepID=A0A7W3LI77_ACTNM|nr:CpaF family protein [Actinomadura namibiensis]MBA8948548.1 pilus assembly protein CpaF [Actinomadura namibiensis]
MGLKNRRESGTEQQQVGPSIGHWRQRLLEEVNLDDLARLDMAQRRARLEKVIGHILTREGPVLSARERSLLVRRIVDEALGLGVLEPLLADPSVTEIMVNGPDSVYIERLGRLTRLDMGFASEAQLYQTIDRIVAQVNRRVDESSPMVDARLPTGERVNVIVPPLSLVGPVLTIRRFPRAFRMDELVSMGALDHYTAMLLAAFVRARLNIVIAGGTGTGKTTFLNALSGFVPGSERIVTIEDSAELQLQQDHVIRLESRPANIEGEGAITIRDLVRNALRMRPDRVIVGEVRGPETLDMLQAMNTGHDGSMVTVHANSAEDTIYRIETLASMSEVKIPYDAIRDQINNAVHAVVFLDRALDGSRRVGEVAVVASGRREAIRLTSIVRFEPEPIGLDRVVRGRYVYQELPRDLIHKLVFSGEAVPQVFGGDAAPPAPPGQPPAPQGPPPRAPGPFPNGTASPGRPTAPPPSLGGSSTNGTGPAGGTS